MNNELPAKSIQVLTQQWGLILALLTFIGWGSLLLYAHLKRNTGFQFTDLELAALSLGGWPLPALLISFPVLFLSAFLPAGVLIGITAVILLTSGGIALRAIWKGNSPWVLVPVSIFLVLAFLRLGLVADVIMPMYFDSAEHYRIIRELLDSAWPTASYYHLGYHVIIAAFVRISAADPASVMLIFGQLILAALPLPIFFLLYRATFSKSAALLGVIFAAFGWFMPAHAVNWGKYPALLSLLLLQFTLGILLIKKNWMPAVAALAATVIHTRSVILLALFGAAWILANLWEGQPHPRRRLILAVVATMLGMLTLIIYRNPILGPILEPYATLITLLSALLAASVFKAFSHPIMVSLLIILLILTAIFIPVSSSLTLLDRPLAEMILFLPLAFIGGLGGARPLKFIAPALAALIILNAWMNISFGPSKCCQLVSRDDATALDWVGRHYKKDSVIAIAGVNLNINAFGRPMRGAGIDAGIWINPLTGIQTVPFPNSTNFASPEAHDQLCSNGITHIYVGARPQSFAPDFAELVPEWYETTFSLPKAHIVKVLNCK